MAGGGGGGPFADGRRALPCPSSVFSFASSRHDRCSLLKKRSTCQKQRRRAQRLAGSTPVPTQCS